MRLSILIPTLMARRGMLSRLLDVLHPQLSSEVELLLDCDNGERSTGKKRNDLMARAQGDYVVFIDDDDLVAPNYVKCLMAGIAKGVDVVCVNAIHTVDGRSPKLVIDKPYQEWKETPRAYLRGVQFRDAVKREIAASVSYPDLRFGEDHAWTVAMEATKLIKSWHEAEIPTYFHEYRTSK